MRHVPSPKIRELNHREIEDLLDRNRVGRIAYSLHDRVDIEPINYVHSAGWLYGRTSPGTKLATIQHNYWVAFEVDEVEGTYDWRSVVVHGGFYTLPASGSTQAMAAWEHAVSLLRSLWPEMFTADDPTAYRWVLFRIAVQEVRGLAATSESASGAGPT
ncbi:MAG TPA: pyridoxamine 5'-phosphate oxidase family protein [Longimicrobiales bacterium]